MRSYPELPGNTKLFMMLALHHIIGSYKCDGVTYMEKKVLIQDPDGYLLRFSETQLEK